MRENVQIQRITPTFIKKQGQYSEIGQYYHIKSETFWMIKPRLDKPSLNYGENSQNFT